MAKKKEKKKIKEILCSYNPKRKRKTKKKTWQDYILTLSSWKCYMFKEKFPYLDDRPEI